MDRKFYGLMEVIIVWIRAAAHLYRRSGDVEKANKLEQQREFVDIGSSMRTIAHSFFSFNFKDAKKANRPEQQSELADIDSSRMTVAHKFFSFKKRTLPEEEPLLENQFGCDNG